jgi:hypothetical protein
VSPDIAEPGVCACEQKRALRSGERSSIEIRHLQPFVWHERRACGTLPAVRKANGEEPVLTGIPEETVPSRGVTPPEVPACLCLFPQSLAGRCGTCGGVAP